MSKWESVIAKMAQLTQEQLLSALPLAMNDITPPADNFAWRPDLPICNPLLRFYTLCDGGTFGNSMYTLFPHSEVGSRTDKWRKELREAGEIDELTAGRLLVFGEDSAGAPLVWSAHTDKVCTYWFKAGEWEEVADSPEAFMEELFHPDANANAEWALAIEQIRSLP